MDCGFNKTKPGGLFSKVTREGVSAYVSCWIKNGWIILDLGEGERKSWPEQWLQRRCSTADGVELARVFGSGATVHGSMNRKHREREGKQANSSRPRARLEVAVGAGAAMAGGESSRAHANKAQMTMKHEIESTGEKEGSKGSHRGAKRGRRRLGDGCSHDGADGGSRRCACSFLMHRGTRGGAWK